MIDHRSNKPPRNEYQFFIKKRNVASAFQFLTFVRRCISTNKCNYYEKKKKKKNCTTFLFLSFSFFFLFFFFYISITPRNLDHRGLLTGTKGDSKIYSTAKYAPASQKYLIPCVVYFGSSGSCRRKSIFPACCLPLFFSFLFSTTINRLMGSRIYFIGEIFVTI